MQKKDNETKHIYLLCFGNSGERWYAMVKTAEEERHFATLEDLVLFLAEAVGESDRLRVTPPDQV